MTGAVTHQTKAMIRGQQREDRYRLVMKDGLPALRNMRDFRQIFEIVQVVLERNFKGQGKGGVRATAEGRGIRGIRWGGRFGYTNTLYHEGEIKTGWNTTIYFVLDAKLSVLPVLQALEQMGMRANVGGHRFHPEALDISYTIDVFILSDDFATMAVKRRFAGLDDKPGDQPTYFPKET